MHQLVQNARTGQLQVLAVPAPHAKSGQLVVRNVASLISAGTERMALDFAQKSLAGKAKERPDLVRQVLERVKREGIAPALEAVREKLEQRNVLGYSCAGVVEEVGRGAEEFQVGERVACAGAAYAHHADVVGVPKNLAVKIPDGVSFEDAAYVTLGAIALQGVRIADVRLGETVAVIGLGLLGQLSVQLLNAAGCRVLGIDLDAHKVATARELGAEAAVLRSDDVAAAVAHFSGGVGVDAVLVTAAAASNDPIELAAELCRDRGRVCMVGAVKMDIPRTPFYLKELELRLSRSYGPGRYDPEYEEKGHDYPLGYVRWTERRNMQEFLRLVAAGQVTPAKLSTHRFPLERAPEAYAIVTGERAEPFLGILLTYAEPDGAPPRALELRARAPHSGRLGLGFIGAGSFGKSVLLPRFAKHERAALVGIATATGLSAQSTGEKFGFGYCTTEHRRLLDDAAVQAVVVTTRHGSHAHFVCEALLAGKDVFVEKPLALDDDELQRVLQAQQQTGRMIAVGFNRRFSPLAAALRQAFAGVGPLAIQYRVNAGAIAPAHWIHDPHDGGGRIIGEVCHFVDFVQFLAGAAPREVFAYALGGAEGARHDTVCIVLRFADGSVASINYFATGDKALPKEQVEVYGGGGVGLLDDFRALRVVRGGKTREWKPKRQEKGFDQEVAAFLQAGAQGGAWPIALESLVATTRATFAIEESLRTGRAVGVG